MRIGFLNSCLEPRRDGVGDYTHSLAQECMRQGQECCLVALNDRYVSEPTRADSDGLQILRLPMMQPWPERIAAAQALLDTFAPEWISLQFVPYAFHPKGFVRGLGPRLRPLLAGRRVHVMFHELWLGETQGTPLKHRLIGALQKMLVRQMLKRIAPQVVHTSNEAYVRVLERQGVRATRLPMFGSIPLAAHNGDEWLFAEMGKAGVGINSANRNTFWLGGFFGALHPVWPPEPFIGQLRTAASKAGRQVVLLSIGRMGNAGKALWAQMAARYAQDVTFVCLGPQPGERVSEYFNSLDFGIAASPWSLIGKSSSVAAMLEHGLPVIVNREDSHIALGRTSAHPSEPLLHKMDAEFMQKLAAGLPHAPAQARLPATARCFLESLNSSLQPRQRRVT